MHVDAEQVRFDNMEIGKAENNAGIFVGNNVQRDWHSANIAGKSGFGVICGNYNELRRNRFNVVRCGTKSGWN